jgi:hypothetical protein
MAQVVELLPSKQQQGPEFKTSVLPKEDKKKKRK